MKPKILLKILLPILCYLVLFSSGCATVSVQRVGTTNKSSFTQSSQKILLYTNDNQIKKEYEVLGIISYNNPGKWQVLTLSDAIEPLKNKARQLNANAIIIDRSDPIKSGIISTGIYVEARAIYVSE